MSGLSNVEWILIDSSSFGSLIGYDSEPGVSGLSTETILTSLFDSTSFGIFVKLGPEPDASGLSNVLEWILIDPFSLGSLF